MTIYSVEIKYSCPECKTEWQEYGFVEALGKTEDGDIEFSTPEPDLDNGNVCPDTVCPNREGIVDDWEFDE